MIRMNRGMKKRAATVLVSCSMLLGSVCSIPAMPVSAAESANSSITGTKSIAGITGTTASDTGVTATQQLEDLFTTIDLMDATITDLQGEMTAGNVTSAQLTRMYIDRIKAYDEKLKLNSIISINPNALADAAALDQERQEGKVRGPLHGIPIVVKANYEVAGMATSAGSNAFANMIAKEDSFAVRKLREAGAVILAQANMSEFACSAADSSSTLGGVVHNAYDGSKTPAGSSGGTAVAVTCNFAAAGLGTDTGGSIRNPSSFSDLYGIRPSKGLTSIDGVVPLTVARDTTGPMARTAEDLTLMLEAMAGSDQKDDYTLEAGADALVGDGYADNLSKDGLKGKRIGFLASSFSYEELDFAALDEAYMKALEEAGKEIGDEFEPDLNYEDYVIARTPNANVQAMINRTMANMRKAGAEFVDLSDVLPDEVLNMYYGGASEDSFEYDLNKFLYDRRDTAPYKTVKELYASGKGVSYSMLDDLIVRPEGLSDSFEETPNPFTVEYGGYQRGESWGDTLAGRDYISEIMQEYDIDAVMYLSYYDAVPNLATVEKQWKASGSNYQMIMGPALGLPDISIPMGFSDTDAEYTSEMPLGLNLFTEFGKDGTLLEIAYAYEQQAGENIRRMPERTPALPDANLSAYLEDLMDRAYSIDYTMYKQKPEGKIQLMLNAYEKANNVNLKDPYATYEAAKELARAYDNVIAALEASGVDPDWPGNTYGAPVWTWKGTGSATATFTCKTDSSLVKKMTAAITSKVTKQATYSAPGKKTFTATVTLNGKTFTDTKTLTTYVYSNEWVNGLWYNKDGTQTYKYKLSWKKNKKGWWVEDTNGWYPTSRWQKINGTWYYFRKDGYMAANEWYDGYWLSKNGAWTYKKKAVWKRYGTKWMYRTSDWYAKGQRQKIDGIWYGFDLNGYLVSEK